MDELYMRRTDRPSKQLTFAVMFANKGKDFKII
jgi:hypothetical protein